MRRILYNMIFLLTLAGTAYGQNEIPMLTVSNKVVNIGLKAGFNASFNSARHLYIGDTELDNIHQNNKVGYTVALFTRINFKKHHFLQPELSFDVTKSSMSIEYTSDMNDVIMDNALIKTSIFSLNLPILYGYKFVDKQPYGMSFVVGPQLSWFIPGKSENSYENFYQQDIKEDFRPFNFSGVIGLGVNVSNIYFDIRYAIGLIDITKSITYNKETTVYPYNESDLKMKRNRNILSFAIGAIF